MARFFFDVRDGDRFIQDDEGLVLTGINQVRAEATRGLADTAKDALPGSVRREIAIEVRDESGAPLLRASIRFEVEMLGPYVGPS